MAGLVLLLVAAFGPTVVLLPHPPEHLHAAGSAALATGVTAAGWRYVHADDRSRRGALGTAAWLCLATVVTAIALQPLLSLIPTTDVLPWLFGLQGKDIGDAILFEAWFELWLLCLAGSGGALLLARATTRVRRAGA